MQRPRPGPADASLPVVDVPPMPGEEALAASILRQYARSDPSDSSLVAEVPTLLKREHPDRVRLLEAALRAAHPGRTILRAETRDRLLIRYWRG